MINITPSISAINYHKEKVTEIFNNIISTKYISRGNPQTKIYLPNCFLNFLVDNFNEIIGASPNELLMINNRFNDLNISTYDLVNIKSFFIDTAYKKFQNKYGKEFLNKLSIDTCVYCNRNYTLDLIKDRARAELDHWFPKENYYLLALSFFNLIPSCHSCNHIKHNNSPQGGWENAIRNINHPYLADTNEKFTFDYILTNIGSPKTTVKYNNHQEKIKNTLEFNKIKEIYDAHSDRELKDLYNLRYNYSNNYLEILIKNFKVLSSKHEAYRILFGIELEEKDYHKRPFSKFKNDIINKLLE